MSRAEELADILDRPGYGWHTTPNQIAAELRRLAKVEADHEALKKAISEAVPVAWINEEQTIGPNFLKRHLSFGKYFSDNPLHYKHIPLYTLEGIRTKP